MITNTMCECHNSNSKIHYRLPTPGEGRDAAAKETPVPTRPGSLGSRHPTSSLTHSLITSLARPTRDSLKLWRDSIRLLFFQR